MRYYYQEVVYTFFMIPSGEVFLKYLGNPSGQPCTTDDNCIGHLFTLCFAWRMIKGKSLFESYCRDTMMAIYADDHIFTVKKQSSCGIEKFDVRSKVYTYLGLRLDPTKDKVDETLDGHTFLGLTARYHNGKYYPQFNRDRALSALLRTEKLYTTQQKFERVMVLAILTVFDPQTFDEIQRFGLELKARHPVALSKNHCLSKKEAIRFWVLEEGWNKSDYWRKLVDYFPEICRPREQI